MRKQFTLSARDRLKSRKQIDTLFTTGKKSMTPPYRIVYLIEEKKDKLPTLCFGIGVATRYFKKAVDRNRIKRLTREAWRLQKNELQQTLQEQKRSMNVFFIYTAKELPAYDEVYAAVATAIHKLLQLPRV